MHARALIIDNASTLAMRIKVLLELKGLEVDLLHYAEWVANPEQFYQLVIVAHGVPYDVALLARETFKFSPFILIAPSASGAASNQSFNKLHQVLGEVDVIYPFLDNRDITEMLDVALSQSGAEGHLALPHVLCIDNDLERLKALENSLRGAHIPVTGLHRPEDLDDVLRLGVKIDVLLSDFHMGDITGLEMFRKVRLVYKDAQCLLVTSRQHHQSLLQALRAGVTDVLEKPIDEGLLLQAIQKCWHTQQLKLQNHELTTRLQDMVDVLVEKDSLLRVIFDNTPEAILVMTHAGRVVEANASTESLFGVGLEQLRREPIATWLHDLQGRAIDRTLQQHSFDNRFNVEAQVKQDDDSTIPVLLSMSAIDYHGEPVFAGVVRNISQFKNQQRLLEDMVKERTAELESAKEEAERANESKSMFLANMSHELRTPMHSILSFARFGLDMVKENQFNQDKYLKYFDRISTSGNRLLGLLNNLLDLSKLEAGRFAYNPSRHQIKGVLTTIVDELAGLCREKQLNLNFAMETDVELVCDADHLMHIVRNLLSNAIKFTPEQKSIYLNVAQAELDSKRGLVPAVAISVRDEGVGIPEGELELIFDKFAQSSKTNRGAGGTGLGLAICRELTILHHGKLWAENNPEGGATFTLLLPKSGTMTLN